MNMEWLWQFQIGECLSWSGLFVPACDCGLDGLCPEDEGYISPDVDGTEGDGIWQPGDGWIDENQNGIPDYNTEYHDNYNPDATEDRDVWPPPNRIWDELDICIGDYGQDGEAGTGDAGENDGRCIGMDGYKGDNWIDKNDNGKISGSNIAYLTGYAEGSVTTLFNRIVENDILIPYKIQNT